MPNQSVIVLDFGGQYNQLIARRVRECNVYCEVKPNTMTVDEIRAFDPIGIIFTGGPQSAYAAVSYTHQTLPTNREVEILAVAVLL